MRDAQTHEDKEEGDVTHEASMHPLLYYIFFIKKKDRWINHLATFRLRRTKRRETPASQTRTKRRERGIS